SQGDTLSDSTKRLVEYTAQLKRDGYKQVILSGQSFGAFLSLMAADSSSDVDGVIATAPAAYGSFDDFYDSWRLNATRLYPLLEHVKRARIMVFYFHGDDFDPGGRRGPDRLGQPGHRRRQGDRRLPRCLVRLLSERPRGPLRGRDRAWRRSERGVRDRPERRQQAPRRLDPAQGPGH